ncbi:MAG: hypothetical protein Q9207_003898 [Kuettlingeria erythrocarpa]
MAPGCLFSFLLLAIWALHAIAVSVDCSIPPLSLPWSNITVSANGIAVTRGIELGIGSPTQIFSLRPSTVLNNTRIANVLDCGSATNTSCVGGKGGVFDSSKSSTFVVSLKNRWNGSAADTETATGAYVYFHDVINFQANGTVAGYPLVMNSDLISGPASGLPLGQNSSFLAAVTEARVAPSSIWGLDAGDRSLSPRDGSLVVGGYDTSRIVGDLTTFPIGNWTKLPCPLQVTVTEVWYFTPGTSTRNSLFDSNTTSMTACVEPFQQRFTFLPSMVKQFARWTRYNDTYPALTFPSPPDGALEIKLDNGYRTIVPNDHLFTPKRGSDDDGHYVVTNSSIVESGIEDNTDNMDGDSDLRPILGGLFLSFNYLVVDYDNNRFQMASSLQGAQHSIANIVLVCTPTPTPMVPDTNSSQTDQSDGDESSRAAAIGGGTAGGIALVAAMGGICYFFSRKRRQAQRLGEKRAAQRLTPTDLVPRPLSVAQKPGELALVCQFILIHR